MNDVLLPCETGKRQYVDRTAAQIARGQINKRDGYRFKTNVFHCDKCGAFHVGRERTASKIKRKPRVTRP